MLNYFVRDMAFARHNKELAARTARGGSAARVVPPPTRQVKARHRLFDGISSYAGEVIRRERAKLTGVFLNEAAEAKWAHGILSRELLQIQRQIDAGWWAEDDVPATIRKIEIKSVMDLIVRRYMSSW